VARRGRTGRNATAGAGRWAGGLLALAALLLVGLPAAWVGAQILRGSGEAPVTTGASAFSLGALGRTVLYAGGIGVLATALAVPMAMVLAGRGGRASGALAAVPLLLPTYLTYSGWGQVRAPRTVVGDLLAKGPPEVTLLFDRVLAVGGLALWAWPIGAVVLAAGLSRVPGAMQDALRMDRAGGLRRAMETLAAAWSSVVLSVVVIGLVMAGSAIPLHLAQVRTGAIELWKFMSLSTDARALWAGSLPLWAGAFAAAGAIVIGLANWRGRLEHDGVAPRRTGARVWAGVVWAASVLVPWALFAWALRSWASVGEFWSSLGPAVVQSGSVGVAVGAVSAGVCLLTWAWAGMGGLAGRWRAVGLAGAALLVGATLGPGVLVGAAVRGVLTTWLDPLGLADTPWALVIAHSARFAGLGVLVGLVLAQLETREDRARRALDGADGLNGWARVCLRPAWGVLGGVCLAGAALSIHEIEASVQVQPPGSISLARSLLDTLHYLRDEQLSAAAVNLVGIGVVVALAAGWLVAGAARTGTRARESEPRS
jgi:ABC-type Fe3+ transport system permease subunit